jgi:hypothetical protein
MRDPDPLADANALLNGRATAPRADESGADDSAKPPCDVCGSAPCTSPGFCENCRADEARRKRNGDDSIDPDKFYVETEPPGEAKPAQVVPPLKISEWLSRDLPSPDFIMGDWLSTTSRALLVGPTGLGKTNFALALALHAAAGTDFLHWRGRRPSIVLYIDGEMARRLLRSRIDGAATRLGQTPPGFHALSHEDVEGFAPLNTPAGQAYIEWLIEQIGKPDLIVFDSIMCLLAGEMKEGEPWAPDNAVGPIAHATLHRPNLGAPHGPRREPLLRRQDEGVADGHGDAHGGDRPRRYRRQFQPRIS